MKLLADENVDESVVDWLIAQGLDVKSIHRTTPGISDHQVIAIARDEQRIILTYDLDFGEIIFLRKVLATGVILLRVDPPLPAERLAVLQKHWQTIVDNAAGNFVVVSQVKIRVRPIELPP